jgi:hypothetical protein
MPKPLGIFADGELYSAVKVTAHDWSNTSWFYVIPMSSFWYNVARKIITPATSYPRMTYLGLVKCVSKVSADRQWFRLMTSLKTYWIMIRVDLIEVRPVSDPEQNGSIGGYFRNFGVTAASEREACDFVAGEVEDGNVDWSQSKVAADVMGRLDRKILERSGDWSQRGIWYRSGHVFFPP